MLWPLSLLQQLQLKRRPKKLSKAAVHLPVVATDVSA
jgi:hypothetical protein